MFYVPSKYSKTALEEINNNATQVDGKNYQQFNVNFIVAYEEIPLNMRNEMSGQRRKDAYAIVNEMEISFAQT